MEQPPIHRHPSLPTPYPPRNNMSTRHKYNIIYRLWPCTGLKSRPRPGPQIWIEAQARPGPAAVVQTQIDLWEVGQWGHWGHRLSPVQVHIIKGLSYFCWATCLFRQLVWLLLYYLLFTLLKFSSWGSLLSIDWMVDWLAGLSWSHWEQLHLQHRQQWSYCNG